MPVKIGLVSDTHSTTAPLKEALALFEQEQVDRIICAGDIAGYGEDELEQTIELLTSHNCLMISGNHDHYIDDEQFTDHPDRVIDFFESLPAQLDLEIEGLRIHVAHAEPPDIQHGGIKLLDPEGRVFPDRKAYWTQALADFNYDILIVGHTHQVFCEQLGNMLVINPGSTTFNHNCSILDLPDMKVRNFALSGKTSLKVWNWGMFHRGL